MADYALKLDKIIDLFVECENYLVGMEVAEENTQIKCYKDISRAASEADRAKVLDLRNKAIEKYRENQLEARTKVIAESSAKIYSMVTSQADFDRAEKLLVMNLQKTCESLMERGILYASLLTVKRMVNTNGWTDKINRPSISDIYQRQISHGA